MEPFGVIIEGFRSKILFEVVLRVKVAIIHKVKAGEVS